MYSKWLDASMFTHRNNNIDPTEAKYNCYPKGNGQTSSYYDKNCEVYKLVPLVTKQTKDANKALATNPESEVKDEEVVKPCEETLLDV